MNNSRSKLVFSTTIVGAILLTASFYGQSVSTSTLSSAKDEQAARAEFKRLRDLQAALKKIPIDKQDTVPHKNFLKANDKDITFSEPSAEWYVRSERFWALREKYKDLPIADEIAWTAAQNPLPGECEGYLNCYLYVVRTTDIEYLKLYPNGKYSHKAMQEIIDALTATVADLGKKENHTGPTDASDKAELAKLIQEMSEIVSKTQHPEKSKLLSQIKQIGDAYK